MLRLGPRLRSNRNPACLHSTQASYTQVQQSLQVQSNLRLLILLPFLAKPGLSQIKMLTSRRVSLRGATAGRGERASCALSSGQPAQPMYGHGIWVEPRNYPIAEFRSETQRKKRFKRPTLWSSWRLTSGTLLNAERHTAMGSGLATTPLTRPRDITPHQKGRQKKKLFKSLTPDAKVVTDLQGPTGQIFYFFFIFFRLHKMTLGLWPSQIKSHAGVRIQWTCLPAVT
ncbi:hypothetical protein SODALDRAFT_94660 [Sodiomyces alkalinus F11]|uniref:Uncharacterized protein n=1 Tax=Sodiomyces alkalinus (strain CBS 110278 / VKM F-3762 / F11) TaxID=1314773 RepID=A0A3N2Q0X5_SODAK|nr:hypothetical protein SODALDRAFT_94660 [Sodiomyces alkalinus F11]ROT40356.1 hypothetical protein SODALDRAFT_94660 [Sodiomyces alkalinus F11]